MSGWPEFLEDEAETEVKPSAAAPEPTRTRNDSLRQEVRRLRPDEELLVLAVLEVSAAVDRLTAFLRERER